MFYSFHISMLHDTIILFLVHNILRACMLDHLRIAIPVHESYLTRLDDGFSVIVGNVADFGFEMASRHVDVTEDGTLVPKDLYAPYESLPSSYSGLAVKFFDKCTLTDPYVEIKASPAKLLQGHNVYGGESVGNAACEMLGILFQSIPELGDRLDVSLSTIRHIDTTFSSSVTNEAIIPKIIDYLSRINNGQTRATKNKKYETTAYWGGESSRLLQLKCYAKYEEMLYQIETMKKEAKAGNEQSKMLLDTVYTPELLEYSKKLLRWEARIKSRKLERLGLPTGLFDFIKYQQENPDVLTVLWKQAFAPIFDTFKGQTMPYSTDDDLHQIFKDKLKVITPAGRVSYTRANNVMNFFHLIRDVGLVEVKTRYSSSTYYRLMGFLNDVDLSAAWLANLHTKRKGDIVPLVNFCHVDFVAQFPIGYVPPNSRFNLPLTA